MSGDAFSRIVHSAAHEVATTPDEDAFRRMLARRDLNFEQVTLAAAAVEVSARNGVERGNDPVGLMRWAWLSGLLAGADFETGKGRRRWWSRR